MLWNRNWIFNLEEELQPNVNKSPQDLWLGHFFSLFFSLFPPHPLNYIVAPNTSAETKRITCIGNWISVLCRRLPNITYYVLSSLLQPVGSHSLRGLCVWWLCKWVCYCLSVKIFPPLIPKRLIFDISDFDLTRFWTRVWILCLWQQHAVNNAIFAVAILTSKTVIMTAEHSDRYDQSRF